MTIFDPVTAMSESDQQDRPGEQPPPSAGRDTTATEQEAVQPPVFDQPAATPLPREKVALILEAALLAAGHPLPMEKLLNLFSEHEQPGREGIREALDALAGHYAERGIELKQVASGYRLQVRQDYEPWVSRLWEERAPRYTRALLETLALIAYRQPITRGEIEDIRGVSVSSNIIKSLQEREWIRIVGHRDVPGRPAMFATTKAFLDYFGLRGLDELPALSELRDIDSINAELDLAMPEEEKQDTVEEQAREDRPAQKEATGEPGPEHEPSSGEYVSSGQVSGNGSSGDD